LLRRFTLEGNWEYSADTLIAFITGHAAALQFLTIYGGILERGTWLMVLEELANAARGSLEYISILFVSSMDADSNLVDDPIHKYGNRLPYFDCVTHFAPLNPQLLAAHSVNILSDTEEEGSAEEEGSFPEDEGEDTDA
jgi:hypothetical protein